MAGNRPGGVTVLAILEFLGGILDLGGGAYYLNYVGSLVSAYGLSATNVTDYYAFYAIELVFGLIALAVGYAFWTGKAWGWRLGIFASIASVIYSLGFGAYFVSVYGDYTELSGGAIGLIVSLIVIYYLTRPHVKAYFGTGQPTMMPPPPPPPM
ncbi:MAG: hypothetical protein KGI38_11300 [Thaumarchaeota archaeon]|nr:hypothetical protein [Nitrososphaerota archaeon]